MAGHPAANLILVAFLLGACGDDAGGRDAPATVDGPRSADAPAPSCAPAGSCATGPLCGTTCCPAGHGCDRATYECRCGTGPACGPGDSCERGGPVGEDLCGTICCGASGPCPQ